MPDTPPLTPRDYDQWQLATPQQLLTLLQRLGVSGSDVARRLRVPRSAVSMWRHGSRAMPPKHLSELRTFTQDAFAQTHELNRKAVALAPTEDLRQALHEEFVAIWIRWKAEVLAEAGTLQRGLERNYQTLGIVVGKKQRTREDVETAKLVMETMAQQMELLVTALGEGPSPEDEAIARLTAAHEAQTTNPPGES
jgi:transcriptional regulator with XRE-family HTH domain